MRKAMLGLLFSSLLVAPSVASAADDGAALWAKHCTKCHGKEGKGDTKVGKKLKVLDYTAPGFQEKFKDEELLAAIKDGKGEKDEEGERAMPAYGSKLSEAELKATLAFVRAIKPAGK